MERLAAEGESPVCEVEAASGGFLSSAGHVKSGVN